MQSKGHDLLSPNHTLRRSQEHWALLLIVAVALALKVALLATDSIAFTSDEAVMALMGKHISQGEFPTFYYGEAYVGSLDAVLIAIAFKLVGQSVLAVRLVQVGLYIGTICLTYLFTKTLFNDRFAAQGAGWWMAIPPVLLSLHTTAGLGSYGETLLIGTALLLIGYRLLTDRESSWLLWIGFGLLFGLGFWTFGLILVYVLPIGLLLLPRLKWQLWGRYAANMAMFFLGSAPWWRYNLAHDWAALKVFYDPAAGTAIATLPLWKRALVSLGLGLPALIGLRPSWTVEWISIPLAPLVPLFYLAVLGYALHLWRQKRQVGTSLLWLFMALFIVLLVFTRFGTDATGRYMLPLYSALAPLCGIWLSRVQRKRIGWAILLLGFILGFNLLGNIKAIVSERGLTTEFWSKVRFDPSSDRAFLAFLLENDLHYGYSNRHTHFRTDFLSGEQVLLLPRLSSREWEGLCINLDGKGDRYPAYTKKVESSDKIFYVTTRQPYLDTLLHERFAGLGVTYQEKAIGPYRIFYDLSRPVRPQEICKGSR